jgi:hypothetical protein
MKNQTISQGCTRQTLKNVADLIGLSRKTVSLSTPHISTRYAEKESKKK